MAIKTRLVAATAALLCLATVMIGAVAIGAVTSVMTGRVDDQLREGALQPSLTTTRGSDYGGKSTSQMYAGPVYQPFAIMTATEDGRIVQARQAGFNSEPLNLPKLPSPLPAAGQIHTVPSRDGEIDYRIMVSNEEQLPPFDGHSTTRYLVIAAPLTEVTTVRDRLVITMVLTVSIIAMLGAAASWWITRRGLRPVDDMIDTAVAIADGDVKRRADQTHRRTELGKLAGALNTMVTKLVHALREREAERNRLRGFIADASHELRTPLATVGGYAELYESGGTPPGPALDRAMSRIRAENARMATLVEDLLLLARLDQDTADELSRCDLTRLTVDCVDDARALDTTHPVTLRAEETVFVNGNDSRLRQVVGNLLSNARRHTPEGTSITVSVTKSAGMATLTVSDNGPGIAAEHRDRVFDRLYRADPSRSRATGGSGLGLAIVKSIVEAHGGRVWMDSPVGQGTRVYVELADADASR